MKKKNDDLSHEEWKNKYLLALADYQNLEKRTRDEISEIRKFASEVVLARLLPVIDTLKKAKDHIKDPGLDIIYKEILAIMEEQGVEKIAVTGHQFDPHEMECVEVVDGEENLVVEEVLSGYRFRGKILRVAQVKVGKKTN